MFEEGVELEAVEAAPGTVEVLPGLGLLPAVVVVEKLVDDPRHFAHLPRAPLPLDSLLLPLLLPNLVSTGLNSKPCSPNLNA